jgi:Holliday junction resolvase RusA-like endonuclease
VKTLPATSHAFTILGKLPSLNEYVDACRSGHQTGARFKRDIEARIGWAIREAGLRPVNGKVHVEFVWLEPDRRRDLDNIRSAAKYILDALVACGVLKDDSQAYVVGLTDFYAVDKANPRVIVTVTEQVAP